MRQMGRGLGGGLGGLLLALSAMASPQYDGLIGAAASRYGIEPALVKAVIQCESNFDPYAVSPQGAEGLMQLMPATQATLGVPNAFEPRHNIEAGVRFLAMLRKRFGPHLPLILGACNAGPQAVIDAGYRVPAFAETKRYVACVEAARRRYQASGLNGLSAEAPTTPPTTPEDGATPVRLMVTPLHVPPSGGRVGQRLLLHLEAWNVGTEAAHGVVSLTYPVPLLSLLALRTAPDNTTVHLPTTQATQSIHVSWAGNAYDFLQSAWPAWQPGQRRTAVLALVPRLAQDIALHCSILLYDPSHTAVQHRWSTVVRIPVQYGLEAGQGAGRGNGRR